MSKDTKRPPSAVLVAVPRGNLYVRAIRWATDRLGNQGGIVTFVHPNSLLTANSLTGMRACLQGEFSSIYVVNLKG